MIQKEQIRDILDCPLLSRQKVIDTVEKELNIEIEPDLDTEELVERIWGLCQEAQAQQERMFKQVKAENVDFSSEEEEEQEEEGTRRYYGERLKTTKDYLDQEKKKAPVKHNGPQLGRKKVDYHDQKASAPKKTSSKKKEVQIEGDVPPAGNSKKDYIIDRVKEGKYTKKQIVAIVDQAFGYNINNKSSSTRVNKVIKQLKKEGSLLEEPDGTLKHS